MAIQEPAIGGEVDHFSAPAFRDALLRAIDRSPTPIVAVDLSGVTFMNSAGYGAIAAADEYAIRHDRLLLIRNLSRLCTRVVRLCDDANRLSLDNDPPSST